ncbi:MAG: TlpA family protein disulfide reductase [Chitinophagales bacterium]|nr:TlpA family protein disulfide reductase [Chitinophagaceae bacterium]MCB9064079.1 TlpA family protein disulfide reductase [Chitinophagales bacterium]
MKRILSIAIALSILTTYTAIAGNVTIRGEIKNRLSDSVTFSYAMYKNNNWLDFKPHKITEHLDEKGRFTASFDISEGYTLINIQNGGEATEIFVTQGAKLMMTVDCSNFDESIKYKGIGEEVANFMAKHILKYSWIQNTHRELQSANEKSVAEFPESVEKIIQGQLDFLVDNAKGLPNTFINYWDSYFEFLKYSTILDYPIMHEVIKQQSYSIESVPDENYKVINTVPKRFNDKWMPIQTYRNYIAGFYYKQLDAQGVKSTPEKPHLKDEKMLELAHQNMPTGSEEYVYANYLQGTIKGQSYATAAHYYNKFIDQYPSSIYKKMLEKLLETKRKLSVGQPAIDITFRDENGKKVKLSDLKGNVVYLDFWASWCGPCKAQFPHTAKLKEHFAGKNVVFAYVSIDGDKEAWEKAKEKYHLTGLHMLAEGEWQSNEATEYGVRGIPAYFLIDKEGNFAAESTPRPSQSEQLIEMIEALL